jgi:RNA polymerase sigma factor (sigma-70 family)
VSIELWLEHWYACYIRNQFFKVYANIDIEGGVRLEMGILKMFTRKTSGDEFENVYTKYYSVIFRNIYYITGDVHATEDLVQETFMKLYNAPPEHTNIAGWLNRVATNLSYNYLRNQKNRTNKDNLVLDTAEDNVTSIEDIAIRNYELKLTRNILNIMLPRDRICLLLKFSGYKYNEIAEILGVDKNSIGTILSRAQKKFKDAYLNQEKRGEIL